jgi:hypothetical protein
MMSCKDKYSKPISSLLVLFFEHLNGHISKDEASKRINKLFDNAADVLPRSCCFAKAHANAYDAWYIRKGEPRDDFVLAGGP